MPLFRKKKEPAFRLDPSAQRPAVRRSICTGEMTGGWISLDDGKFHEYALIQGPGGFEKFCAELGVRPEDVETVY